MPDIDSISVISNQGCREEVSGVSPNVLFTASLVFYYLRSYKLSFFFARTGKGAFNFFSPKGCSEP